MQICENAYDFVPIRSPASWSYYCDEMKELVDLKDAKEKIEEWLGDDYDTITNKDGDKIFVSKDNKKKVRFDIENSHGDKPHAHLEEKVNDEWQDADKQHRIYPLGK